MPLQSSYLSRLPQPLLFVKGNSLRAKLFYLASATSEFLEHVVLGMQCLLGDWKEERKEGQNEGRVEGGGWLNGFKNKCILCSR